MYTFYHTLVKLSHKNNGDVCLTFHNMVRLGKPCLVEFRNKYNVLRFRKDCSEKTGVLFKLHLMKLGWHF